MHIVTGATGLLGSHLLFELCSNGYSVRALYRNENRRSKVLDLFKYYNPNTADEYFNSIDWVKGDVTNISSLEELILPDSFVYHCAGYVSFDDKEFTSLIKINREGTGNVVNVCLDKNIKKLCHVSSTAAIGGEGEKLLSEKSKWKIEPETTGYAISKYNAEREVWRGIEEGLNAVIVNPCVILGAGDWKETSLTIFETVKKGTKFYPPGSNATVDARDVARIMNQLQQSEISSERFLCIGSNQEFKTLITEIADQLNTKRPTKLAKKWMVKIARRVLQLKSLFTGQRPAINKNTINSLFSNKAYDNSKIKKALNYSFYNLHDQVENGIKGRL